MSPVRLLAQEASAEVDFGSGETLALFAIMAVCVLALVVAFILVRQVLSAGQGTEKMREIARAIQEGSRAYLSRQFRTLAVFVVLLFFLLLLLEADSSSVRIGRSVAFLVGAVFSALAGYTGMQLAVRANVRVAAAADQGGLLKAMPIAFRAGGVAGMFVVGLGLLGAAGVVFIYQGDHEHAGHPAGPEGDRHGLEQPSLLGRGRHAHVGPHGQLHAGEAGQGREDGPDQEGDRAPDPHRA